MGKDTSYGMCVLLDDRLTRRFDALAHDPALMCASDPARRWHREEAYEAYKAAGGTLGEPALGNCLGKLRLHRPQPPPHLSRMTLQRVHATAPSFKSARGGKRSKGQ